jgi:PTS system nitrogen regulatory IIA component
MIVELKANNKRDAIKELAKIASTKNGISEETIFNTIWEREKLSSTGIENGVAVPHGKIPGIKDFYLIIGVSKNGIDFQSIDKKLTNIIFLLLSPETSTDEHLKLLAEICDIMSIEKVRNNIKKINKPEEIIKILSKEEQK